VSLPLLLLLVFIVELLHPYSRYALLSLQGNVIFMPVGLLFGVTVTAVFFLFLFFLIALVENSSLDFESIQKL
jgi:hypothetical protein